MMITCYQYKIPFKQPFVTGRQSYHHREGIIFKLQKDGISAWGEAAPLPGFSRHSPADVLSQIKANSKGIKAIFQSENPHEAAEAFYAQKDICASFCFAMDTLVYDFLSQQKGIPLAGYLFDSYRPAVPINGVIGASTTQEIVAKAKSLIARGFDTLKLKMSNLIDPQLEALKIIRTAYPTLKLRIDANKGWALKEAVQNLTRLEELRLEYCEEPLANASVKNFKELHAQTTIPLALDESLGSIQNLEQYLPFTDILVLKPMVIGTFSKLFATKALADTLDNTIVFTSSLESGIGRLMTATLASGLGAKQTAHGLATGSLLTMDVWQDATYINNGRFILPDSIGMDKRYQPNLKNIVNNQFEL